MSFAIRQDEVFEDCRDLVQSAADGRGSHGAKGVLARDEFLWWGKACHISDMLAGGFQERITPKIISPLLKQPTLFLMF